MAETLSEFPESHDEKSDSTQQELRFYAHGKLTQEQLDAYHPHWIAQGGEHAVFNLPDHPNLVAKLNLFLLQSALEGDQAELGWTDRQKADYQRQEQFRLNELRDFFGGHHVPPTKRFLLEVPITQELLEMLHVSEPIDALPERSLQMVQIQKRLEIPPPSNNKCGVGSNYAEFTTGDQALLSKANEALVYVNPDSPQLSEQEFCELYPNLQHLVELSTTDSALRESLSEFLQKAIKFSQETGEALDLVGSDNIFFTKQPEGNWDYTMPDALSGRPGVVDIAREQFQELATTRRWDPEESIAILNAVNYTRIVNWLAEHVGISDRLKILPSTFRLSNVDIEKLMPKQQ